ncbi:MAG: hypothetical protein K2P12_00455 [Clostridia bacterium]|nr:hypothetical protein [Clostridia bacterium]
MGLNKPDSKVIKQYGKYGRSIRQVEDGIPNSRVDFYDQNTHKLLQQRWYDKNGQAIWDRDWDHNNSNGKHFFPHDHPWDWGKKPPRQPSIDFINKDYK